MIGTIVAKYVIKGVAKNILIQPLSKLTVTLIPSQNFVTATAMKQQIVIDSKDLIKFGIENLSERYLDKKMEFQITRLSNKLFGIMPKNEYALLFTKNHYSVDQLKLDMDVFEQYLDELTENGAISVINKALQIKDSDETEELLENIIQDMDFSIKEKGKNELDSFVSEQELVNQVLEEQIQLLHEDKKDSGLPQIPKFNHRHEEIDMILKKQKSRLRSKTKLQMV